MAVDQQPVPNLGGHVRAPIPTISRFQEDMADQGENITEWLATFDNYVGMIEASLPAGQALQDSYKNNLLMILLGKYGAQDYRRNPDHARLGQMTFAELRESVNSHFRKKPSKYKARYDLYKRTQEQGESLHQFVQALRRILEDCHYDNTDDILCSHLIFGTNDARAQHDLMSRPDEPDLPTTLRVLEAYETAANETTVFRGTAHPRITTAAGIGRGRGTVQRSSATCYGCGNPGHRISAPACPAQGKTCSKCGKTGHFARVCRSAPGQTTMQQRGRGRGNRGRGQQRGRGRGQTGTALDLEGTAAAAISAIPKLIQHQFHIRNSTGKYVPITMAADTGANISLMTENTWRQFLPDVFPKRTKIQISCADGRGLSGTKGAIHTKIAFAGRIQAGIIHIVDNKGMDIIGLNFLQGLRAKVDCDKQRVVAVAMSMTELKREFPRLFREDMGAYIGKPHTIRVRPGAQPVVQRVRQVPQARLKATEEAIRKMDQLGVWEPVEKSEWVHPMVAVPKKDGTMRITTDLTKLNDAVIPDRQLLPRIKDIFQKLTGATVFSKLDLKKGYYHIPLDEQSSDLTTTATPLGLRRYRRLPMGLKDAAAAFQRRVNQALQGLDGVHAYIDDVLVHGSTQVEHDLRLRAVLTALDKTGFRLQESKLIIGTTAVPAFGFIVSADGIFPDPANVQAITEAEPPTDRQQLQRFLGMINYFQDFLRDAATLTEPLRKLTRQENTFHWGSEQQTAFEVLKKKLAEQTRLQIFDPDARTFVTVDASDVGIGAMLSQISQQTRREVPTAFYNKTLDTAQRNYSATEREALACILACEHWEHLLLGRRFTLRTDHEALRYIFTSAKNRRQSSKFQRWKERLGEFDFDIEHIPGGSNQTADYLSRLTTEAKRLGVEKKEEPTAAGIQLCQLQEAAKKDDEYQELMAANRTGQWNKQQFGEYRGYHPLTETDGLLQHQQRIIPPSAMRAHILQEAHRGHPGGTRMKALLRQTYTWPRMSLQADQMVQNCQSCQRSTKSRGHTFQQQVPAIPRPTIPGQQWALDLTGPFPNGQYIAVCIDYATRFPEILISKKMVATTLVTWLQDLFTRYGLPAGMVTDNGPQFVSKEFQQFLRDNDIHHYRIAVYNPQENGLVERFNKYLKQGVQTFRDGEWIQQVHQLVATYRRMPNESGQSPMDAFLGRKVRTPVEPNTMKPMRRIEIPQKPQDQKGEGEVRVTVKPYTGWSPYKLGQQVLTKREWVPKGTSPWSGPKKVTRIIGTYTYQLDDGAVWNARKLKRWISRVNNEDDSECWTEATLPPPQPRPQPFRGARRGRSRRRSEAARLQDGLTPYFTPHQIP